MKECLLVFVGSGFGGVVRYLLSLLLLQRTDRFPLSTLISNVIASFIIGILFAMIQNRNLLTTQQYLLLAAGFCGGLSTFSTFALENNLMFGQQQFAMSILYIVLSIAACLLATAAGKYIVG